ncbi:unnamed protein product [Prunus brigantina]
MTTSTIYTHNTYSHFSDTEQSRTENRTEPILSFQVTKFFSLSLSLFFFTFLINQTFNSSQQTNSLSLNMNGHREDNSYCYFHPKEVVVGVCSLCLTERLLILAAKKGHHVSSARGRASAHRTPSGMHKKPHISLPKIFAFSSFLNRQWKPNYLDQEASTSQEDSFISIKFEENGVASWEKNRVSKVSLEHCNMSWNHNFSKEAKEAKEVKEAKDTKSVIEHGKSHAPLRWRKRIGHLFQLIRWKRSNKGNVCHVSSKVEGVKVRKGWIRTLTKRRGAME